METNEASGGQSQFLREASASISELLARLREQAGKARRQQEESSAAARKLGSALDELQVQTRFAQQLATPLLQQLQGREAELRQRYAALMAEAEAAGEAQKRLDQLVKQIEMSSSVLSGEQGADANDPWLMALRGQIIQGREEERLRLAREVHDGTAQVVANLHMSLEHALKLYHAGNPQLAEFLTHLRAVAKQGLQEVRGFISDLRPGILAEHGARAAITEYAQGFAATSGLSLTIDLAEWPKQLASEVEIVLYRIVQEALQNIYKHARQANVLLRSFAREGGLTLTIRDDGPGFDPREVARRSGRESWGLTSMRERTQLVGGNFSIASRPGYGTEVTVSVPVIE